MYTPAPANLEPTSRIILPATIRPDTRSILHPKGQIVSLPETRRSPKLRIISRMSTSMLLKRTCGEVGQAGAAQGSCFPATPSPGNHCKASTLANWTGATSGRSPSCIIGDKGTLPKQVTITIFFPTKTAQKPPPPWPSPTEKPFQTPPHKMDLNHISSLSLKWEEVSSCKESSDIQELCTRKPPSSQPPER